MGNENDLIRRADAIEFINSGISLDTDADREYATEMMKNIPSAEATCETCADRAVCIMADDGRWVACKDYRPSAEAVTHGRLIDADALSEKLCETTIFIKDGEVFQRMINDATTVSAEAVQGEWGNRNNDGAWATVDFAYCSVCKQPIIHKHTAPLWSFCPNCGARMYKGGDSE